MPLKPLISARKSTDERAVEGPKSAPQHDAQASAARQRLAPIAAHPSAEGATSGAVESAPLDTGTFEAGGQSEHFDGLCKYFEILLAWDEARARRDVSQDRLAA